MLERIGGECAGAVSLLPEDMAPSAAGNPRRRDLTTTELQAIVSELPNRPLMAGAEGVRLSLAGAQDKLPVIVHRDGISLPLGDAPSTHILKPEPDRFPGLAVNEVFCMTLARSVGLSVAESEYRRIGDKPCALVKRYDRRTDASGVTRRLHQEDFCQALGIPPERKYQAEGGPALVDCVSLLRDWSTAPVLDIPAFVDGLIYNVLIGNADAHGKNFSLLYSHGNRRLSPHYDLVCTLAWPALSNKLAMKIGGCDSINAFTIGDWRTMARKTGLSWPMVRERITNSCHRVRDKLDGILTQTRNHDVSTVTSLYDTVQDRVSRMLDALSRQRV
jgi:serine/threonine-protein kinase HipA